MRDAHHKHNDRDDCGDKDLSEKQALQLLLQSRGLRPQSKWGQNFLLDKNLLAFIVRTAAAGADDFILEVGPGTGRLTLELARTGATVLAVELDRGLAGVVRELLADYPRFALIEGDILDGKSALNPQAIAYITENLGGRRLQCISNLPYSAGTPVIANLLSHPLPWESAIFLLQYEVGLRLFASPGSSNYGILAVKTAFAGRVEILRKVPPEVFWPVPGVDSAVVRINFFPAAERAQIPWDKLDTILRAAFRARRKTIGNTLRGLIAPERVEAVLAAHGAAPAVRGEELPPETFLALAKEL